mmetsp:Transcript_143373/g.458268  ORF Transcript_143373/g.458268 Transcript_143373/m.458268 type:complete len:218 (+) Transcript_143373:370-1023(+)
MARARRRDSSRAISGNYTASMAEDELQVPGRLALKEALLPSSPHFPAPPREGQALGPELWQISRQRHLQNLLAGLGVDHAPREGRCKQAAIEEMVLPSVADLENLQQKLRRQPLLWRQARVDHHPPCLECHGTNLPILPRPAQHGRQHFAGACHHRGVHKDLSVGASQHYVGAVLAAHDPLPQPCGRLWHIHHRRRPWPTEAPRQPPVLRYSVQQQR